MIASNHQIFITPFDIHDTLIHIAIGNNEEYQFTYSNTGQSLLEILDDIDDRYCKIKKFKLSMSLVIHIYERNIL